MEAMMPDVTVVYQLVIFLAALVVIKRFVINPIAEVLKGRNERIQGAEQEALRLAQESDRLDETYRKKIRDARDRAKLDRAGQREQALDEEKGILGRGREEAQSRLQAISGEIREESGLARERLRADAVQISRMFAEKLLGRPVS